MRKQLGFMQIQHVRASRARRRKPHQILRSENLEPRRLLATVGGSIDADTVWRFEDSPFEVTSDVTVQANATLEIEAGVEVRFNNDTGIGVEGRLLAEGTAFDRIRFDSASDGEWDGIAFENTLADSRITYADMINGDGQGEAINVDHSRLLLDNIVWGGTSGTILELEHPSLIVRNSHFPASDGGEIIHGEHIEGDEYLIIDGNVFENSDNGGDVIDVLGADRPGPVMQILNNVFKGGGDDGLDLDGTDAHVEGNLFMNFNKNTSRATTANAIATGLPQSGEDNRTQVTIVRNIFVDNDHAILLKEDAFATIENNLFVDSIEAAIQFNEVGGTAVNGPGMGARLENNIFYNNGSLFKNLVDNDEFRTDLTILNTLMPNDPIDFDGTNVLPHSLGTGNTDADPMFVDEASGNYRLRSDSPAIGAGVSGLDLGAYVLGGPTLEQVGLTTADDIAEFQVGGPGITHYRYRLNDEPYGPLTGVDQIISLHSLPNDDYSIDVLGMNSAGEWYVGETNAFQENTARIIAPRVIGNGETFPMVIRVANWQGETNSLLTQPMDLLLESPVAGGDPTTHSIDVKKGVGSAAPLVALDATFHARLSPDSNVGDASLTIEISSRPEQVHGGELTGDIVWDSTMDHHVTSDISIPAGSSLTIESGTRVLMDENVNLIVNGDLTVNGTLDDPVVFTAADVQSPWGGLELVDSTGSINYAFFTNGGADTTRTFGHSDSQPLIMVDSSTLDCDNCYVINNTGKAFGSSGNAIVNIHASVISDVDTGAQFNNSVVTVTETWLKNIPNGDAAFDDDDNDGFYFSGVHSNGTASRFQDSFIIDTKDDGLDHNGARLEVIRSWIQGADHEGIASSNRNDVRVIDSVFTQNNQGVEAGYRDPDLFVTNSVLFNNRNDVDPDSPITAGIRFGDGYDGSNGSYTGHIEARNVVAHDNGDNVRNWDGEIGGPQEGAIDIANSLTNDPDYDGTLGNQSGVPVFGPFMHLLRGSAGRNIGNDGTDAGRLIPPVSSNFTINRSEASVRLNEVYATGTDAADSDFIEILNIGGASIDLSGYALEFELQTVETFTIPAGTIVQPGEFLSVLATESPIAGQLTTGFDLDPRGGTVRLMDNLNQEFDQIGYNRQLLGHSLSRSIGQDWTLGTPTMGTPTRDGTNQTVLLSRLNELTINEWLAESPNRNDFVELYNTSGLPMDLGGLVIGTDSETLTGPPLPQHTYIQAGELIVFDSQPAPDQVLPSLAVDLPSTGGEIAISANGQLIESVQYRTQTPGVSQGRVPNGGEQIEFFDPPNPLEDNPSSFVSNTFSFRDGVSPTRDYAGTEDTWLRGSDVDTPYGDDDRMDADGSSGGGDIGEWPLIRWDISSMAAGTTVDAAMITLTINNASNGAYDVYAMATDWVESEATWNGPSAGVTWETAGTGSSDRGAQIGVLDTDNSTGTFDVELNADGIAVVQSWLDDPTSNFGIILYDPPRTDGIEIRTSEYSTANARPMLTLDTTPPAVPNPVVAAFVPELGTTPQSISVTFSERVTAQVGDLRLHNRTTDEFILDFDYDYDTDSETATWTVASHDGVLPPGEYETSVSTEEVLDIDGNQLLANEFTFTRILGDIDGDQILNVTDISGLCTSLGQPATGLTDLDGDGNVTVSDVNQLIRVELGFEYGDANFDGNVDAQDHAIWDANRFTSGTDWSTGDFTCDGSTDGSDFNVWNANRPSLVAAPRTARKARLPRAAIGDDRAVDAAIIDSAIIEFSSYWLIRTDPAEHLSESLEPVHDNALGDLTRWRRHSLPRRADLASAQPMPSKTTASIDSLDVVFRVR